MRFKSQIKNVHTFHKFIASLSSLGRLAWLRLDDTSVRFTIIPEQGTQVWAVLSIDAFSSTYLLESALPSNVINLELPLQPLSRALRSALTATSASIRLTKKDNIPTLSLTIVSATHTSASARSSHQPTPTPAGLTTTDDPSPLLIDDSWARDRETIITQDIPVRVLPAASVEGIHEPRCREPDVHILLPPLLQLKSISERFTKLSLPTSSAFSSGNTNTYSGQTPKLDLAANMHGDLRLGVATDALSIESTWSGLANPELDARQVVGGEEGVAEHPSTRMKAVPRGEERGWARVRIDGRDWGRVLSVGRLGGRVIACFVHEQALILYVYLEGEDEDAEESVLTYYISSYSA